MRNRRWYAPLSRTTVPRWIGALHSHDVAYRRRPGSTRLPRAPSPQGQSAIKDLAGRRAWMTYLGRSAASPYRPAGVAHVASVLAWWPSPSYLCSWYVVCRPCSSSPRPVVVITMSREPAAPSAATAESHVAASARSCLRARRTNRSAEGTDQRPGDQRGRSASRSPAADRCRRPCSHTFPCQLRTRTWPLRSP